jgi:hypothetical protein
VLHLKKLTKDDEVQQNGRKIQNGVENQFLYFFSQRHNLSPILNSFSAFEAYFWYLTFVEKTFFSGNQNGGLIQDGDIFEKNRLFFEQGWLP